MINTSGDVYADADPDARDAFDERLAVIGVEYGPTIVAPPYVGRHRREDPDADEMDEVDPLHF
jgi:FAD/FMN-containing dehydrogenase